MLAKLTVGTYILSRVRRHKFGVHVTRTCLRTHLPCMTIMALMNALVACPNK